MATLKVGARLKSNVCDTEVMVISCSDPSLMITCGGVPVLDATENKSGDNLDAAHADGTLLGKRYVSVSGNSVGKIELLCVKAGKGSLAVNGERLSLKDAKPLPSSD
jgi:hypothetical protein